MSKISVIDQIKTHPCVDIFDDESKYGGGYGITLKEGCAFADGSDFQEFNTAQEVLSALAETKKAA